MNSIQEILFTVSYVALPVALAIILHECAHGWVANRFGDPTAREQGRLTLNPLAHIDPFGSIILPLMCVLLSPGFLFGWAKPVPIDPRYFRRPRRDMAIVAAAGPVMNALLAVVSLGVLAGILAIDPTVAEQWPPQPEQLARRDWLGILLVPLAAMAFASVSINVLLMAFNLLPIPPLDGGRILTSLLPVRPAMALHRVEPYGMLIILLLIVLDPQIHVLRTIIATFMNLAARAVTVVG
jgi:Zn-dependent protease